MKPFVVIVAVLALAATPAARGGGQNRPADCPQANVIAKMVSAMQAFGDAQPLDRTHLKACGAELSKDGKDLRVCLANGDFAIADMANSFVLPLKQKGQFILQINFSNGAGIVPGTYDPAAGYGKPFWVSCRGEGGGRGQGHHRHAGSGGGDSRDHRHERLHGLRPLPPENPCRASAALGSRRRVQCQGGTLALVSRRQQP